MRTKHTREWTYEEVKTALQLVYGPITGIAITQSSGYVVMECPVESQPSSAEEAKP